MKLYTNLFMVMMMTLLFACGGENRTTNEPVDTPPADTTAEVTEPVDAPKDELPNQKIVEATFDHCTAYAAATDYYFTLLGSEEMLEIRVQDPEVAEGEAVKVPEKFTVETADGPPDTNPEMVGKLCRIVYNTEGAVIAIELAE
ncbi:MAG: hypothetical protein GY810_28275 [Aureispira sp.]|nr:hypothetical protein [Aureispira sp.]